MYRYTANLLVKNHSKKRYQLEEYIYFKACPGQAETMVHGLLYLAAFARAFTLSS